MNSKQAVIYTRVSSDAQREQGYSLDAQNDFLIAYAKSQGLTVIKTFTESMSAKEAGRIEFNKMLAFAKKNKCHVIIEKNDRLLRNEEDEALILDLTVKKDLIAVHLVKDNLILCKESKPYEIFIFHLQCGMSSLYPRNLSNEVKKGMLKKAELGFYPLSAPIGYKNIKKDGKSIIGIDEEVAPVIKRIYELYATGLYSYKSLAKKVQEEGFYPRKTCQKSTIEYILTNPIYIGEFDFNGKRYKGNHKAIISKELWHACKNNRENKNNPKLTKHAALYRGLIKCAVCGCTLTYEHQKGANQSGDYYYYRCTGNRGGDCKKKYLKQEVIDDAIMKFLERLQPSEQEAKKIIEHFKDTVDLNFKINETVRDNVYKKISLLTNRLNKLYDDKIDGLIDENFYMKKRAEYSDELEKLEIKSKGFLNEVNILMDRVNSIIELCQNAPTVYINNSDDFKRELIKLLCLNLSYDGKELTIEPNSAIKPLLKKPILKTNRDDKSMFELIDCKKVAANLYYTLCDNDNVIFFERLELLKKYA